MKKKFWKSIVAVFTCSILMASIPVNAAENGNAQKLADGSFAYFEDKGATEALDALNNSKYANLTVRGDADDATSFDNMLASIQWIRECNRLRELNGLDPLLVNDTMMAMAQADANYSDVNMGHAKQFSIGENCAWNYDYNPFTQWYDDEKAIYDKKEDKEWADDVGHYLNIIKPRYTVTGFAINTRGTKWPYTYVQVFSARGEGITVDEYEKQLLEYYNSIKTTEEQPSTPDDSTPDDTTDTPITPGGSDSEDADKPTTPDWSDIDWSDTEDTDKPTTPDWSDTDWSDTEDTDKPTPPDWPDSDWSDTEDTDKPSPPDWPDFWSFTLDKNNSSISSSGMSGSSDSSANTSAKSKYSVVSGAGCAWTKGSGKALSITTDGDFSKFVSVAIDGAVVDKSNYSASSGSTVVSLNAAYLDSLSTGEHTYRVNYTDGAVETTFRIDAASPTASIEASNSTTSNNSTAGNKAPQTGDTTTVMMAVFMMMVSAAGIALSLKARKDFR